MPPPAVKQEAEEEGVDRSCVEVRGVHVEQPAPLESRGGSPESAVGREISCLGDES